MTDLPAQSRLEARPPAKVNLTLEVRGRRPDGYHELRSIFLRVGLTDRLTMRPGSGDRDGLTVTGLPGAPVNGNLVLRALDAIRAHTAIDFPPLDVTLEKRIPAAAGLGGGSSDCASALRLAQEAWGVGLSTEDELRLGAELGSDVPFFLSASWAALVEGRGEVVSSIEPVGNVGLLLVTPRIKMSTADVFSAYDQIGETQSHFDSPVDFRNLVGEYARFTMANQLWDAAASLVPALPEMRWWLEETTSRPWLMSGSGPTMYSIYDSATEAADDGRRIVTENAALLNDPLVNAVDLVGPDPAWRYP